jgi:hypothetical protein
MCALALTHADKSDQVAQGRAAAVRLRTEQFLDCALPIARELAITAVAAKPDA